MPASFNRRNFHQHTFCLWLERPKTEIEDRVADFTSRTGSRYFFDETGVYRLSDHWARVANCRWRLEGGEARGQRLGYAKWTDFLPDDDDQRLYWIAVDFDRKEATYHHRDQGIVNGWLRTAPQTIRRMREVRKILCTDEWAAYLDGDVEQTRREWVSELIQTDRTLAAIRTSGTAGR